MKLNNVFVPCGVDRLSGLLYLPDREEQSTGLVMAHGFTAGKYTLDGLASYLAERGYPVLTYDCVGHKLGGTGGEMRRAVQAVDNLEAAVVWFRRNVSSERVVLVGHSMGGVAVLNVGGGHALQPDSPVTAVACICTGARPSVGFDTPIGKAMLTQRQDYVAGAPARWLIDELDDLTDNARAIGDLPALLIAGRQDVVVSVERVQELAAMLGATCHTVTIDTTHQDAPDRARGVILQWLQQRAAAPPNPEASSHRSTPC